MFTINLLSFSVVFSLFLGCQGDTEENPIVVECPEIQTMETMETMESSELEILDISLDSFELLILDAPNEGLAAFRELQRKYERRPVRFIATVREILNALLIDEDPGDYSHVIFFLESHLNVTVFYYLPKTIDLLFTEGDKITVTGEFELISFWDPSIFYISDVEFKRE